jgi:hypothetical protein
VTPFVSKYPSPTDSCAVWRAKSVAWKVEQDRTERSNFQKVGDTGELRQIG